MARKQFLNSRSDCDWLRSTALRAVPNARSIKFRSFVLEGNEDSPSLIILYRDANPKFDSRPILTIVNP